MSEPVVPGLVSTIIPVHNRPELLREAVASTLAQTWPALEAIVVDDGSTDETPAVADALAARDARVRVLHLARTGRIGLVREAGRLAARGEFIQYLDSDDLLAPTKFEVMVAALGANPDCDVAYCWTRRYRRGEVPRNLPAERTGQTMERMLPGFLERRAWHTSTPIYRRALIDRVGPWTDLQFWEDIEYDVRIAAAQPRLVHVREFLTDYRDHDDPRASELATYVDPECMTDAARAAALMYAHLAAAGLGAEDPDVRHLLDDAAMIARRCRDLGFEAAARDCDELRRRALAVPPDQPLPPLRLGADLSVDVARLDVHAGEVAGLPVRVTNRSSVAFRLGDFGVLLGARYLDSSGVPTDLACRMREFDVPLLPGETRSVDLEIQAPWTPGPTRLAIDLVWNGTEWLADRGGTALELPVMVGGIEVPRRWHLVLHGDEADATLIRGPGATAPLRVAFGRSGGALPWHVQLNTPIGALRRGDVVTVRLRARADTPRSLAVGVAMGHSPWRNLGAYREFAIDQSWHTLDLECLAEHPDPLARLHVDLGRDLATVELDEVTVTVTAAPAADPVATFHRRPAAALGILMYHGVVEAPLAVPDWCFLAAETFRRQLAELRRHADVVPLAEARDRLLANPSRPLAAITFDDGFLDNATVALPHLVAETAPATVFLATGPIDHGDTIWYCRLNEAIARTSETVLRWEDRRYSLAGSLARGEASAQLQARLKCSSGAAFRARFTDLLRCLGADPDDPLGADSPFRLLDRRGIASLLGSGLVDLGAHTVSHAILAPLPSAEQRREIAGSLAAVSRLLGRPTRLFAYPNGGAGDYDEVALSLLREAGVQVAVTAVEGINRCDTPALELFRYGIGANSPEADMARFLDALHGMA